MYLCTHTTIFLGRILQTNSPTGKNLYRFKISNTEESIKEVKTMSLLKEIEEDIKK